MIATIRENGKTYFATTYGLSFVSGTDDAFFQIPNNLLIWKSKGTSDCMIAASEGIRNKDLLLYETLFRGELTIAKAYDQIVVKMKAIFKEYGRLKENGDLPATFFIAKGDKVMKISPNGLCTWVDSIDSCSYEDLIHSSVSLNQQFHPIPRLAKAIKTVMDYYGVVCFPMAIMDVKNQKITYIKSKGDIWALESSLKKME
jgi:hypothetical protein